MDDILLCHACKGFNPSIAADFDFVLPGNVSASSPIIGEDFIFRGRLQMYFTEKGFIFDAHVEINPVLEPELVVPVFVSIFPNHINLRDHPWFHTLYYLPM